MRLVGYQKGKYEYVRNKYLRGIHLSGGCSHIAMLEPTTAAEVTVADKVFPAHTIN